MRVVACGLVAVALLAQDQPQVTKAPVLNAAVSGVVRDKNTGKPLAHYNVSTTVGATWVGNVQTGSNTKDVKTTTDESGHYKLPDLPAAAYRITARDPRGGFGRDVTKNLVVSGHDIDDVNFDVVVDGSIKGRVLDENKEPVPGITVILVSREYYLGSPGYFFRGSSGPTNDRGEYSIDNIPAGQPFYLLAEFRRRQLPAHSETPLNAKLRRRVPARTWYPNSPAKEGAAPVILRAAETRDHVDIEIKKAPNFCAEGTLITATGGPGVLTFSLEPQQPSSGTHEGGGMYMVSGFGTTGSDGAFRFCDLAPGSYRIEASQNQGDLLFGTAIFNVADEDLKGLKLAALPTQPVAGEVVLDGPVPEQPFPQKVTVSFRPMLRSFRPGERASARAEIPGAFALPAVIADDYQVMTFLNAPGLYVKDVLWAGNSIHYQPLRMNSSSGGTGLRVVIGQDGGTISAVVSAKDGSPAQDIKVIAFPADLVSEGMFSAALVYGQTDQTGSWTSQTLAPGRYYVGAVDASIDYTVELMARLWRSRSRFTEVELAPKGTAQVTLETVTLAP